MILSFVLFDLWLLIDIKIILFNGIYVGNFNIFLKNFKNLNEIL